MGTSRAFFLLENRDLSLEMAQERMKAFRAEAWKRSAEEAERFGMLLTQVLDMDRFEGIKDEMRREDPETFALISRLKEKEEKPGKVIPFPGTNWSEAPQWLPTDGQWAERRKGPVLGWRADAKWLPLFEENFCGSASSLDAGVISEIFGTPVLAFSIFDSAILFVSYRDPEKAIRVDYAKPNFEEFEEYDDRLYKAEFPQFLCAYGDEQILREIWEGEEVFADDRMLKLCEVIGTQVLYDGEELPEGYERVE